MNRRAFLGSLIGGVAASAAVRTWPFRVFSFPSAPVLAPPKLITESYREYYKRAAWLSANTPFNAALMRHLKVPSESMESVNMGPQECIIMVDE